MEISDVRINLMDNQSDRLKAFCSITFDDVFVVRDLKIVDGTNGLFVAMPSRRVTVSCSRCGHKNHLRAKHCNDCGTQLESRDSDSDGDSNSRLHRDVAHPISADFRATIQERVLEAYEEELGGGNQREHEDEYEEGEDESINEYDSLIAGLGGGSGARGGGSGAHGGDRGGRGGRGGRDAEKTSRRDDRGGRSGGGKKPQSQRGSGRPSRGDDRRSSGSESGGRDNRRDSGGRDGRRDAGGRGSSQKVAEVAERKRDEVESRVDPADLDKKRSRKPEREKPKEQKVETKPKEEPADNELPFGFGL